jgi:hypothetical protein
MPIPKHALSRPTAHVIHRRLQWNKPAKSAKALPTNLERRVFADTRIIAYRLAA